MWITPQTRAQALKHYESKVDYIRKNLETLQDTLQKKQDNLSYLITIMQSKLQAQANAAWYRLITHNIFDIHKMQFDQDVPFNQFPNFVGDNKSTYHRLKESTRLNASVLPTLAGGSLKQWFLNWGF